MITLFGRARVLFNVQSYQLIPSCSGRYLPPGTLHLPHNQRFDENCDPIPLRHPETSRYVDQNMQLKSKPFIANKRPFRMVCKPGKIYWWCSCGYSRNQPLCDGNHVKIMPPAPGFKINKPQFRPLRLVYDKPTEVWFCTCKRTREPPYCDGSHSCEEVQSAIKY